MECLGKALLSSTQLPLGMCPVQGLLPPPQLSALARTSSAAPRIHSRDRDWGRWHTSQLSQDQMLCLSACKKRAKKKCIYFTAVSAAEPRVVEFQGQREQLPTAAALSLSVLRQPQRHLQTRQQGMSGL